MNKVTTILGAVLLVPVLAGCAEEIEPQTVIQPVKTVVLGSTDESGRRIFPGTVQAAQRAQISFRVSGPLARLPVRQGQEIRRGQLLAQIDPRDFENRVQNLQARLADLRAQYAAMQVARPEDIRSLEAGVAAARSRLVEASATFRRYQELYANDNVSKAEYDQRRAAREVAEAELRRASEALSVAEQGARPEDLQAMEARIQALEADLAQAQDQLGDTTLRAPYSGLVAELYVENFEFVQAQQAILSLQDVTTVEVVAQIPEALVARGRQQLTRAFVIRFESLPGQDFEATPTEFSAQADPVTRTYAVTFQTSQPEDAAILAGMTAEVMLQQAEAVESLFAVPVSALFVDERGQYFVWVLDESTMIPNKVPVQVGELTDDRATIRQGLSVGDRIITAGTHSIAEGQQVRLITDELRERR